MRLSIFDLERLACKRAFLESESGNHKSQIENQPMRQRSRIRNVALQMHDLKRISDIDRVELLDYDRQEQCRF